MVLQLEGVGGIWIEDYVVGQIEGVGIQIYVCKFVDEVV